MDPTTHRYLLSQRAALGDLIKRAPEGSIITRSGLEHRLREVQAQLEPYGGVSPHVMQARLVFDGGPVVGDFGIGADFCGEAVSEFTKAVAMVGASQGQPLSSSGPVPGSDDFRMLITGVARGSFGFHFREASDQSVMYGESTAVEVAVDKVKQILQASVGSDEQLAEAVESSDSRALRAIQGFLKVMSDAGAVCGLWFDGDEFRFHDSEQVMRSHNRLDSEYIKESDVVLSVQLLGLFQVNPRAQFRIIGGNAEFPEGGNSRVVVAPIDPGMISSLGLAQIHRLVLNESTVRVRARSRTVGSGLPRYVLKGWQDPVEDILEGFREA